MFDLRAVDPPLPRASDIIHLQRGAGPWQRLLRGCLPGPGRRWRFRVSTARAIQKDRTGLDLNIGFLVELMRPFQQIRKGQIYIGFCHTI